MTNHQSPRNPSGLEAFRRSQFPIRPEEAVVTLIEPQVGKPQLLVDGVSHNISEAVARKLRDDLIKFYGRE